MNSSPKTSSAFQFVDEALIQVHAGHGGPGMVAFRREKYVPRGGPDGGDGGRGGDILLRVNTSIQTLYDLTYKQRYQAANGGKGGGKNKHGKDAPALVIEVPKGTEVYDPENKQLMFDLLREDQEVLLAKGGLGGKGNAFFATARRQAPRFAQPGLAGEERFLKLSLKLLADVGLVGLPNSGKSSLLAAVTRAHPKIANYPFTTLYPNLGVAKLPSGRELILADVPGLIAGAHVGAGLGIRFLKHLERTRLLLHLVDISEIEHADPLASYREVLAELKQFGKRLRALPAVIVLTKMDLITPERAKHWTQVFLKQHDQVCVLSAASRQGLPGLLSLLDTTV